MPTREFVNNFGNATVTHVIGIDPVQSVAGACNRRYLPLWSAAA